MCKFEFLEDNTGAIAKTFYDGERNWKVPQAVLDQFSKKAL